MWTSSRKNQWPQRAHRKESAFSSEWGFRDDGIIKEDFLKEVAEP